MADRVKEYYLLLRSVLRAQPHLRPCLKRCRHCHIFFLTHPCNARRQDLRCPFGCRQTHRKRQSTLRSVAYYQGQDGKKYRRKQNATRCRKGPGLVPDPPPAPKGAGVEASPSAWPAALVRHVRMVVSLIEGRPVSRSEVLAMRAKVLRQHSLPRGRKIDQTVAWLDEHPP